MTTRISTKTYSRKRKRALSDLTGSLSSPSPVIPVFCKDIQETKKRKNKARKDTNMSDASGAEDEVSPSPLAKRLKKHSSSTTTHIKASISVPLQTAPSPSSQTGNSSSATEYFNLPLTMKFNNGHQALSSSEHIQTISSSLLPYAELNPAQPGPRHPIVFKRTRSQVQKENILTHSQGLASPIKIAPSSSSGCHPSGPKAAKQTRSSKFIRRQSADVFRAHTSTSFRRRPSGSHALQRKSNQNQDWLVPPAARIAPSAEESSAPLDPDIDINRSHSFFSPQGFSTPVPPRRLTQPGTPVPPLPVEKKGTSVHQEYDIDMNNATPIPREDNTQLLVVPSNSHVITSSPRNPDHANVAITVRKSPSQIPHRVVHLPHDSIFSSFDISASVATIQVDLNLSYDKIEETQDDLHQAFPSRADVSPASEGDKLYDMFSVLGLAEQSKRGSYQDSGIEMNDLRANLSQTEKKGTGNDARLQQQTSTPKPSVQDVSNGTPKIHDIQKQTRRRRKDFPGGRPISTSSVRQRVPVLKQCIQAYANNEPLAAEDDEDDELLLTSKGWDWDPFEVHRE